MPAAKLVPANILARWSALERGTLGLMLLSLLLLSWQHFGMNLSLVVAPAAAHRVWVESDRIDGGDSDAELRVDSGLHIGCTVREAHKLPYPYCNAFFNLRPDGGGVDLSPYDSVHLTLRHRSSRPDNLKLLLNHFYPAQQGGKYPFKLNIYRLATTGDWQTVAIPIRDFYVPSWWLCQSQTENPNPEFGHVKHFGIASGESTQPGRIEVDIEHIELRGKLLSASTLQRWLLFGWLGWVIGLLLWKSYRLSRMNLRWQEQTQKLARRNADLIVKRDAWAQRAHHDVLTGLLNRAGLQAVLDEAVDHHVKTATACSLLLLDVDYFKRINDELGHDQGDLVLQRFAQLVRERARTSDAVGRWGGEEFLIVCRGTDQTGALAFAQALVRAAAATPSLAPDRQVTCSIGVAQLEGSDLKAALRRADEALYQAKGNGRNRAVMWTAG